MSIPASWKSRKVILTVSGIVSTLAAWIIGDLTAGQAIAAIVALVTQYSVANVAEAKKAEPEPVDNQPAG